VSQAARALADTFVATLGSREIPLEDGALPAEELSEQTLRRFLAALSGPRDLARGHEIYEKTCAACHRIGKEGHDVGPDLLGQLGMAEESLLRDILAPSDRIRPGYETTAARTRDGSVVTGLLKDDGATSLTLAQAGGVVEVLLRKDVKEVRRLGTSLMPQLSETITPADMASLLGWLRSNLRAEPPAK